MPNNASAHLANSELIDLRYRLSLQKIGLFLLTGVMLGTLWASFGYKRGNEILSWLSGDGLPPLLKFFVPIVAAAAIGVLSRDIRATFRTIANRWWIRAAERINKAQSN